MTLVFPYQIQSSSGHQYAPPRLLRTFTTATLFLRYQLRLAFLRTQVLLLIPPSLQLLRHTQNKAAILNEQEKTWLQYHALSINTITITSSRHPKFPLPARQSRQGVLALVVSVVLYDVLKGLGAALRVDAAPQPVLLTQGNPWKSQVCDVAPTCYDLISAPSSLGTSLPFVIAGGESTGGVDWGIIYVYQARFQSQGDNRWLPWCFDVKANPWKTKNSSVYGCPQNADSWAADYSVFRQLDCAAKRRNTMEGRRKVVVLWLAIGASLLVLLSIFIPASYNINASSQSQKKGFEGSNLNDIKSYAVDYLQHDSQLSKYGKIQVLLTRFVKREDIPALGLGCMAASITIEEPPYALVILKGEFTVNDRFGPLGAKYVAYIFDLWAGTPASTIWSADGSVFRTILNDPSLPNDNSGMPSICPTDIPNKTLHYGDTLPAFPAPPTIPRSSNAPPNNLVPAPVSTRTK